MCEVKGRDALYTHYPVLFCVYATRIAMFAFVLNDQPSEDMQETQWNRAFLTHLQETQWNRAFLAPHARNPMKPGLLQGCICEAIDWTLFSYRPTAYVICTRRMHTVDPPTDAQAFASYIPQNIILFIVIYNQQIASSSLIRAFQCVIMPHWR